MLLPVVSIASAVSEVICPGGTSGGSALIASTRSPCTKDAGTNDVLHAASRPTLKKATRLIARLVPREPGGTAAPPGVAAVRNRSCTARPRGWSGCRHFGYRDTAR